MRENKKFVVRRVGGSYVAVPTGDECKRFHGVVKINETAKMILDSIKSGNSEDETVVAMVSRYEVTPEHARKAYRSTVAKLLETRIIEDENGATGYIG